MRDKNSASKKNFLTYEASLCQEDDPGMFLKIENFQHCQGIDIGKKKVKKMKKK